MQHVIKSFNREFLVNVTPGKSVTIEFNGKKNEFVIGDMAEYDSYNLSYHGEILSITDKTVTFKEKYSTRKRRLKLSEFAWRNYNFNLEESNARNTEISYTI